MIQMTKHDHLIHFKYSKHVTLEKLKQDLPQLSGKRQVLRIGEYGYDVTINIYPKTKRIRNIVITSNEPLNSVKETLTTFFDECQVKPKITINYSQLTQDDLDEIENDIYMDMVDDLYDNTVFRIYDEQQKEWRDEQHTNKTKLLEDFRNYWYHANYEREYDDIIHASIDNQPSQKEIENTMYKRAYDIPAETYLKQCGFTVKQYT